MQKQFRCEAALRLLVKNKGLPDRGGIIFGSGFAAKTARGVTRIFFTEICVFRHLFRQFRACKQGIKYGANVE
jgi:hypothetical protein